MSIYVGKEPTPTWRKAPDPHIRYGRENPLEGFSACISSLNEQMGEVPDFLVPKLAGLAKAALAPECANVIIQVDDRSPKFGVSTCCALFGDTSMDDEDIALGGFGLANLIHGISFMVPLEMMDGVENECGFRPSREWLEQNIFRHLLDRVELTKL